MVPQLATDTGTLSAEFLKLSRCWRLSGFGEPELSNRRDGEAAHNLIATVQNEIIFIVAADMTVGRDRVGILPTRTHSRDDVVNAIRC